jgi:hypothetical protein
LCGWGVEVCVGVWKCWGRNIRKQVMRWIVVSRCSGAPVFFNIT